MELAGSTEVTDPKEDDITDDDETDLVASEYI